jgi:hypothetical protein
MVTETVDQVIARLAIFTDEQKSLAWCPLPPRVPSGPHDCRPGGDCGLDFDFESLRSRVIQARFRFRKHEMVAGGAR